MNTFNNNLDQDLKDEYDSMIFDFFEGTFDEDKKNLIDLVVSKIVEKHDFKILCGFLHVFIDNLLCENFMKKDCYDKKYIEAYIYFMNSIDTYFELPSSYYKNQVVCKKTGDTYFNFYVALRTLIDHNIISYRNFKLNTNVKSYVTDIAKKMRKKPQFDFSPDSKSINDIFDLIHKYYPDRTTKETYRTVYDLYKKTRNHEEGSNPQLVEFLDSVYDSIKFYNEIKFAEIAYNAIKEEDLVLIIFMYFELFEFNNDYAFYAQRYFSRLTFSQLEDVIYNIYACEEDVKMFGDEEIAWFKKDYNYRDLFDILKTLLASCMFYEVDAQDYEFKLVVDHERQLFDFITNLIKVNKHYTDLLGKSLDQFFISYLVDLFDPDISVLEFGGMAAGIDMNAFIYLISVFCYLNNVTSIDYGDEIEEKINSTMNDFLHPEENPDFYFDDEGAIGETAKFIVFFLDQVKDYYYSIYGVRVNPLKNTTAKTYKLD